MLVLAYTNNALITPIAAHTNKKIERMNWIFSISFTFRGFKNYSQRALDLFLGFPFPGLPRPLTFFLMVIIPIWVWAFFYGSSRSRKSGTRKVLCEKNVGAAQPSSLFFSAQSLWRNFYVSAFVKTLPSKNIGARWECVQMGGSGTMVGDLAKEWKVVLQERHCRKAIWRSEWNSDRR